MMDELVKRLREGTQGTDITKTDSYLDGLMLEAAREIERLRTIASNASWEVDKLRNEGTYDTGRDGWL